MKLPRPVITTRAFDEWSLVLRDIEGFFHTCDKMTDHYIDHVLEPEEEGLFSGADCPDVESYNERLLERLLEAFGQTSPRDFIWMLCAATIKDVVTAYELYCQHAAEEILEAHDLEFTQLKTRYPLDWTVLTTFFQTYLKCEISPEPITRVRSLRHLLTHRRGELRLEQERLQFGSGDDPWPSSLVDLDGERVEEILACLDDHVLTLDLSVYRHSWGKVRIPELQQEAQTPPI